MDKLHKFTKNQCNYGIGIINDIVGYLIFMCLYLTIFPAVLSTMICEQKRPPCAKGAVEHMRDWGIVKNLDVCILQSLPPPQAVPLPHSEGGLIGLMIIVNLSSRFEGVSY